MRIRSIVKGVKWQSSQRSKPGAEIAAVRGRGAAMDREKIFGKVSLTPGTTSSTRVRNCMKTGDSVTHKCKGGSNLI